MKYPVYGHKPAGPLINAYLREDNPNKFTRRELQLLHYIDRISYEPILTEKLNKGINIIAEDYFGTAVAWGIGAGVSKELLKHLYSFVYKEDLCFLFDGARFRESIEMNHKHENDDGLTRKVRQIHLDLADEHGWIKIDANLSIEKIHEELWKKVSDIINVN